MILFEDSESRVETTEDGKFVLTNKRAGIATTVKHGAKETAVAIPPVQPRWDAYKGILDSENLIIEARIP